MVVGLAVRNAIPARGNAHRERRLGGWSMGGVTGKFLDLQPVMTGSRLEKLGELVKNANSPDTPQIYGIRTLGRGPRNLPSRRQKKI